MEMLTEFVSQGFDAECFGGVMASIEHIDLEFLSQRESPVWAFAGDDGVDTFGGQAGDFRSSSTGNDGDILAQLRTESERMDRRIDRLGQTGFQFLSWEKVMATQAERDAFDGGAWDGIPQIQGMHQAGIISQFRVDIQGKMGTVEGQIVLNQEPGDLKSWTGPWDAGCPEEPVMNN